MFRKLLILALLLLPNVARAEWHEASTEHFVVYSNDRPERLRRFAVNLERFDRAMRYLRGLSDEPVGKANRVTVYMLGGPGDVGRLAGNSGIAGFYAARAGGSVAFVPREEGFEEWELGASAVLFHEYAHHFMYFMGPNAAYPLWFSEGFAEFHATAKFDKDGSVMIGRPPQYRAMGVLDTRLLTIEKVMLADTLKLNSEQREGLYGRGWLLTHYLTFDEKRKGQLSAYLKAINEGKRGLDAAQVFGDLRALQRELERYKKASFTGLRIAVSALPIGDIAMRKLGPGEAATMNVRMRSKRGVDEKSAPGVYAAAKKACAPFPNDPAAQIVLAEAAYDAGDHGAAEAAADRAIAADPKAVDAHVYKAMARMAIAAKAKDTSKESWAAIRKSIVTANRIDPEDPEPLMLFFRSFIEAGEAPSKVAKAGLYYAFVLAPHDQGLRLTAAQAYMNDGDKAKARELLLPLAYHPHNQGLAPIAAKLIEEIDGKGAAAPDEEASPDDEAAPDASATGLLARGSRR